MLSNFKSNFLRVEAMYKKHFIYAFNNNKTYNKNKYYIT